MTDVPSSVARPLIHGLKTPVVATPRLHRHSSPLPRPSAGGRPPRPRPSIPARRRLIYRGAVGAGHERRPGVRRDVGVREHRRRAPGNPVTTWARWRFSSSSSRSRSRPAWYYDVWSAAIAGTVVVFVATIGSAEMLRISTLIRRIDVPRPTVHCCSPRASKSCCPSSHTSRYSPICSSSTRG